MSGSRAKQLRTEFRSTGRSPRDVKREWTRMTRPQKARDVLFMATLRGQHQLAGHPGRGVRH